MDRRYIRTERLLVQAMLRLISNQAFHTITIEDIVSEADVARKTFYAHYSNKSELLWHSLETHFKSIGEEIGTLQPDSLLAGSKPLSYAVFKHVDNYPLFYESMLLESGEAAFIFRFLSYMAQQSFERLQPLRDLSPLITVEPQLMASMLSGALLGALRWWLQHGRSETPEAMAYHFSQIVAPGVLQSMGLDA